MFLQIAIVLFVWTDARLASGEERVSRQELAILDRELNDRVFTYNLVFEASARSTRACLMVCLGHMGCAAFTFIAQSGQCRGHSVFPVANSSWITLAGARSWIFRSIATGCPRADYQKVAPNTCLRLNLSGTNHGEARQACQHDNATLYTMKTKDRADLFQAFIPDDVSLCWLDAVELVEGGDWVWADGEILPRDSPMWISGEPDDRFDADCLVHVSYLSIGDDPCNTTHPFVCEIKLS